MRGSTPIGIPKAKRFQDDSPTRSSPGPAAYNIKSFLSTAKSFGKEKRFGGSSSLPSTPGPIYSPNLDVVKRRGATVSFTKSSRPSLGSSDSPGPGSYSSIESLSKLREPTCKFGTSKRIEPARSASPGPSAYSIHMKYDSRMYSSPTYSFGKSKQVQDSHSESPGPIYSPSNPLHVEKHKGAMFTKEQRMSRKEEYGDFHYTPSLHFSSSHENTPKYSFGKQKRGSVIDVRAQSPGPMEYRLKR